MGFLHPIIPDRELPAIEGYSFLFHRKALAISDGRCVILLRVEAGSRSHLQPPALADLMGTNRFQLKYLMIERDSISPVAEATGFSLAP